MKLEVLGWAGLILLAVGAAAALGLAIAPNGQLHGAFRSYMAMLERERRALFLQFSARQMLAVQLAACVLALAWAALASGRSLILLPLILLAPRLVFPILRKRRLKTIEDALDGWLTIVASMLQVTSSLTDALRQALHLTRGPLRQEVDLLLKEVQVGMPLASALRNMSDRIGSELFSNLVTVMVIGRTSGGALPTLLAETAETLRERKRIDGVIRKHTASSRTQFLVLMVSPFPVAYLMAQNDPHYFDPFFTSFIGYVVLAIAIACWIAAFFLARKIMAVDV